MLFSPRPPGFKAQESKRKNLRFNEPRRNVQITRIKVTKTQEALFLTPLFIKTQEASNGD